MAIKPSATAPTTGLDEAAVLSALGNQAANEVLAGPTTGVAAAPAFRALVAADVPTALNPTSFDATGTGLNAVTGETDNEIGVAGLATGAGTGVNGQSNSGVGSFSSSTSGTSAKAQSLDGANTSPTNLSQQIFGQSPTVKAYEVQDSAGTPVASIDFNGDATVNDLDVTGDITAATVAARMAPITATNANIVLTEAQSGSFVQLIHTTGAAKSITLPAAPTDGAWFSLMLYTSAATEQLINCAGSDTFSQPGGALDGLVAIGNSVETTGFAIVVYTAQLQQWILIGPLGLYPPV